MTLLQRLLGTVLGVLFLLAAFVFASIALGVILAVGLIVWAWLWWRGRSLPRDAGTVIEGEFRDVTPGERLEDRDPRRL